MNTSALPPRSVRRIFPEMAPSRRFLRAVSWLGVVALATGCGESENPSAPMEDGGSSGDFCVVPQQELIDGDGSGIFALTNPPMVEAEHPDASYLSDDDRVIGLELDGEPVAVPLNILWWHEIVNLDGPETAVVVSHCPLTGSSLTFDRSVAGGAAFRVSGLLFRNNLVMEGPEDSGSLWIQMQRRGACGEGAGTPMPMHPSVEISWQGWRELHPDTRVVSEDTGFPRDYTTYPFGAYRDWNNRDVLVFQGPLDPRRPPKEPVFGVPLSDGGWVFPFGELQQHELLAVHTAAKGDRIVVLWNREFDGAAAYIARADGRELTFEVGGEASFRDVETGSAWRMDGIAVSGPLEGHRLEPLADAYVAFWFAWADFQPETVFVPL